MIYAEFKELLNSKVEFSKYVNLMSIIADDNMQGGIKYIEDLISCEEQTAKLIWCDLKLDYGTKENNPILQAREQYKAEETSKKAAEDYKYRNNAECPYCHSKNTKKISTTSKVANTAVFGLFGTKRFKQWHCNNCRSDF